MLNLIELCEKRNTRYKSKTTNKVLCCQNCNLEIDRNIFL